MRKLIAFNQISLDGFFVDINGDMSWAHKNRDDADWNAFVAGNASGGGAMLFGRITYELMASYWPTPMAMQNDPIVAKQMNASPKVVFSTTLKSPAWSNTRLVRGELEAEVRKMKAEPGGHIAILGSGTIVSQLTRERLIDEYQIVVNPIVLGKGRTMFDGIEGQVNLKLASTRIFGNGNVLLCAEPVV